MKMESYTELESYKNGKLEAIGNYKNGKLEGE